MFYYNMNNISFKSTIRPVSKAQFNKSIMSHKMKEFVDYPWTIKESVISDKAHTLNVYDCTVCGFTDGLNVFLMHICPTKKENNHFSEIAKYIKEKVNLVNPNLQGFLLGSKKGSWVFNSELLFQNFEKFLKENNIKYSKFQGGPYTNNVAYSSTKDEWLISNELTDIVNLSKNEISPEDFFKIMFDEVEIADFDEIKY